MDRWEDKSVPSSLSTHLSDLYLDELDKVLGLPQVNAQVSDIPDPLDDSHTKCPRPD